MRRVILGVLCIAGLSAPALAQVLPRLRAEIPFAFHVGDTLMPKGEYSINRVTESGTIIGFRSVEMTGFSLHTSLAGVNTLVLPKSNPKFLNTPRTPKVVFNKYGEDRYFLAEVQWETGAVQVNKSRRERELITSKVIASRTPERITIAATLAR